MTAVLQHDDFIPHVGRSFRFSGWHGTLRLASVEHTRYPGMPGATRAPFSLIFHGPIGDILPEGTYDATIEDGPRLMFHIMPIHTPAPDRQDYQAVFD